MSVPRPVHPRARLAAAFCALVAFLAPAAHAQSPALLGNGDFSSIDINGDPTGWVMENAAWVSIDTAQFPAGFTRSMRVDTQDQGTGNLGYVRQSRDVASTGAPLTPNTNYAARVRAKSSASGLGKLEIKRFTGPTGSTEYDPTHRLSSGNSSTSWTQLQVGFDTFPVDHDFNPATPDEPITRIEVGLRYKKDSTAAGQTVWFAGADLLDGANSTLGVVTLVPTFESVSVYAGVSGALIPGATGHTLDLAYRATGTSPWLPAIAPVPYVADNEFRGSVLLLQPNTGYDVQATLKLNGTTIGSPQITTVTTWSETLAYDATPHQQPTSSATTLTISGVNGSPTAWAHYFPASGGSTIDVGSGSNYAVHVTNSSYVDLEGLIIKGGKVNAIYISNSHHIRIRNCDISGWSEAGTFGFNTTASPEVKYAYFSNTPYTNSTLINLRAGIYVVNANSYAVVIERNLIHHPIGKSSTWAFGGGGNHPAGPSGIILHATGGNHVIRHNDIVGGAGHYFNDVIESKENRQETGGPTRDSDISGNLLANANDDGIELDGGQKNIRFWHNWIEGHNSALSTASPANKGSAYIFRNIFAGADERETTNKGLKLGGSPGVAHFVNNTVFTRNCGFAGGNSSGSTTKIFTRNNIFAGPVAGNAMLRFDDTGSPWTVLGDIDYDLVPVNGINATDPASKEPHQVAGYPDFSNIEERSFLLAPGSPGIAAGIAVANITPAGLSTPDLGAVDSVSVASAWPLRPNTPNVFPMRSVVRLRTNTSTNVAFQLDASTATGATWTGTAGETWLSLSPAGGSTGSTPQILTCTVNASGLAVGKHRTFVSVRTNTGALRTALLEVEVEPATDSIFTLEAEAGSISGGFTIVADASASGGSYAHADAGGSGTITQNFTVPSGGGIYFVHARVRADGPSSAIQTQNSFNLRIDADPTDLRWDTAGLGTDWSWDTARVVPATVTADVTGPIAFTAGAHSIQVWKRESGLQLDTLVVSNSPFPPRVAAPAFSPTGGTFASAQSVTITSATSGATLRYTTNGSTPTRTNGTVYSGPVIVAATTTLKATAYKDQLADSRVTDDVYTISGSGGGGTGPFQMSGNEVVMEAENYSSKLAGGGVNWTLINDPTASGGGPNNAVQNQPNTGAFSSAPAAGVARVDYQIDVPGGAATNFWVHLRARATTTTDDSVWVSIDGGTVTYQQLGATTTGYAWSTSSSSFAIPTGTHAITIWMREDGYILDKIVVRNSSTKPTGTGPAESPQTGGGGAVAAPTFSPAAGTYSSAPSVTISSATSGASIRYTTDGSTPSQTVGTVYSTAVNIAATATLKAIAYKSGMTDSTVTSGNYTITLPVAAPTFSPTAGTYDTAQAVTISTTTSGATIRYTTDGSTPSQTVGTVYSSAVDVAATTTLQAIAYKSGMSDSTVTSGTYTITAFQMSANEVVMEAEHHTSKLAASGVDWTTLSDAAASDSIAMQAMPNTGASSTAPGATVARMDFQINVPTAGNYYVHARTRAATTSDDSIWVSIDGSTATYQQMGAQTTGYSWRTSGSSFVIGAGLHTITVWMREDGIIVDKLDVKTSSTAPSGTGPAESPRS